MQETRVWSFSQEDPLEKGMATHSSVHAWRIPWTEEPGGLQSMGLLQSQTWLIDQHSGKHTQILLGEIPERENGKRGVRRPQCRSELECRREETSMACQCCRPPSHLRKVGQRHWEVCKNGCVLASLPSCHCLGTFLGGVLCTSGMVPGHSC